MARESSVVVRVARKLVPFLLFLAFAGAHYMASRDELPTVQLAAAKVDLKQGDRIHENQLTSVTVQAKDTEIFKTFVSYHDRGGDLLFNRLNRDVSANELITLADLLPPAGEQLDLRENEVSVQVALENLEFAEGQLAVGTWVGFLLEKNPSAASSEPPPPELLEPFRVIGIGNKVVATRGDDKGIEVGDARILSIAVKRDDRNPGTLEQRAIRLIRAAESRGDGPERIRALVMLGKHTPEENANDER